MVTNKHLTLSPEALKKLVEYSVKMYATQSKIVEGLIMKLSVIEAAARKEDPMATNRMIWDGMRKQICINPTPMEHSLYDKLKREGYYNR